MNVSFHPSMEERTVFEVLLDSHFEFQSEDTTRITHTRALTYTDSPNSESWRVWSDDSQRMNDPAEYHGADTLIITCQSHTLSFPP